MIPTEIWRDIPKYEGLYQVSNLGRVRSFAKSWRNGPLIKKTKTKKTGYVAVDLHRAPGQAETALVHSLMLLAFRGRRRRGHECRHLDGRRGHNRLKNLAWGTRKQNGGDKRRHGTAKGEKNGHALLTEEDVLLVRLFRLLGATQIRIARHFGCARSTIWQITAGNSWTHI